MAGNLFKWLVPGLVTVIGGTALAIAQSGAATSDLSIRAQAALNSPTSSWASVRIDGRDAFISGTATNQGMIDDAVARVSSVHGLRKVTPTVRLAEFVSPFPFGVDVKDGATTLKGGYPSDEIHDALLADAGKVTDQTRLLSGGPAPALFEAGARFAISTAELIDQGSVSMADLSLSVSGRARSAVDYDALTTLAETLPGGLTLASLTVLPPAVSPYLWTAKFDGTALSISGNVPESSLIDRFRAEVPGTVAVSTNLSLASGEPSDFSSKTLELLQSLLLLENGTASISNDRITLAGAPASGEIADRVTAAVAAIGGSVDLEAPRVADFTLAIAKTDKALRISGFVPDTAMRDRLSGLPGADVTALVLARGAPELFPSALDFGLAALGHLSEGKFDIKSDRLSLAGRAASNTEFKSIQKMLEEGAPQGFRLTSVDVHPPVADPFVFTATKDATGKIALSGYVPNETVRSSLHAKVDDPGADTSELADGAPNDFGSSAGKGLDVLTLLDSGSLAYDGKSWSLSGFVDTPKKGFAADAAYSIAGLRTAGWTYDVRLPKAEPAAALPTISPYVWRAQKAAGGKITVTGFVPSEAFKAGLKVKVPEAADASALGAGAPDDFGASAMAGLDALQALDEGSLDLAGSHWTLTGVVPDSAARDRIQAALSVRVNPANWQLAIQASDSAPVVTPYLWSATKAEDGSVELSGYLPSETLKRVSAVRAGTVSRDTTAIASGEPSGFADDLLAGLDALGHLTTGKTSFDGSKWSLTGIAPTQEDAQAAIDALGTSTRHGALWDKTITGFAPPLASEAPSSSEPVQAQPSAEPSSAEEPMSMAQPSSEAPSSEMAPSSQEMREPPPISSSSEPAADASSSEPPRDVAPTGLDIVPPMPAQLVFSATRDRSGKTELSGAVPADATAAYFGVIAGGAAIDALTVNPGLPDGFIASGTVGLRALEQLADGQLGFDGSKWWLRGRAEQAVSRDTVLASIADSPGGNDWSVAIDLLAPIEICRDRVGLLAGRNAIVFKSGSATLAEESLPAIDELASDLEICPNTSVHVEGHTDSDGAEDLNLALSVARAETVVNALIDRGVNYQRLYAEGYGESEPIASNDTKEGKQRNRRIAFTITEE